VRRLAESPQPMRLHARPVLLAGAALAALVAVFIAAILLTESPQLWTAAIVAVLSLLAMRRSPTRGRRLWWWNCAAVFGLWALFEGGALVWMRLNDRVVVPVLPRAQIIMRIAELFDPPVFGVRRPSPPPVSSSATHCVLFFGCSYTFGEGVRDDQTFAYLVQSKTGGRLQSRNFGVSGTAPQYALAQIEDGLVERDAGCTPTDAIYLVLPHHLVRVGGKWAIHFGPRYVLQPSGEVVRAGTFHQPVLPFLAEIMRHTSMLYVAKFGYAAEGPVLESDFRLILALVRSVREKLQQRYPEIRFELLYWDDTEDADARELGERLRTLGIPIHELSGIFPGIHDPNSDVYLGGDHHPSVLAHERLAGYLVDHLSSER